MSDTLIAVAHGLRSTPSRFVGHTDSCSHLSGGDTTIPPASSTVGAVMLASVRGGSAMVTFASSCTGCVVTGFFNLDLFELGGFPLGPATSFSGQAAAERPDVEHVGLGPPGVL